MRRSSVADAAACAARTPCGTVGASSVHDRSPCGAVGASSLHDRSSCQPSSCENTTTVPHAKRSSSRRKTTAPPPSPLESLRHEQGDHLARTGGSSTGTGQRVGGTARAAIPTTARSIQRRAPGPWVVPRRPDHGLRGPPYEPGHERKHRERGAHGGPERRVADARSGQRKRAASSEARHPRRDDRDRDRHARAPALRCRPAAPPPPTPVASTSGRSPGTSRPRRLHGAEPPRGGRHVARRRSGRDG
jgi:hypothetical protein